MDAADAGQAARGGGLDPEVVRLRRARTRLIVLIPVTTAAYALAGHSAVALLDAFRLMAVNDLSGWGEGAIGGPAPFLVAVTAAVLLANVLTRQAATVFATLRAGAVMSGSVGLGGTALGLLDAWLSGRWTPPREAGRFVSEGGGGSDWGPTAWAAYHATWLLPLVFGGAAVAGLLWLARTHGRDRWPGTKAAEIKEHGVVLPGVIDKVEFTGARVGGEPRFAVTVDYVGKYGPRRTVEHFVTSLAKVPVRGGQVDVWYDPLGEDGVVLVELNERSFSSMRYPDLP